MLVAQHGIFNTLEYPFVPVAWSQIPLPSFGTTNINAITYGDLLYIAAGNAGKLATAPEGITWTQRASSFGTSPIYATHYAAGLYIAAGSTGKLATSSSGTLWTQRTSSFGSSVILGLTYFLHCQSMLQ
jgi:hypothetical protein